MSEDISVVVLVIVAWHWSSSARTSRRADSDTRASVLTAASARWAASNSACKHTVRLVNIQNRSVFQHWFQEWCRIWSRTDFTPPCAQEQDASTDNFRWIIGHHLAKLYVCEVCKTCECLAVIANSRLQFCKYGSRIAAGVSNKSASERSGWRDTRKIWNQQEVGNHQS